MPSKIVDINGNKRVDAKAPVSDFWFAQIDVRLGRIEFMVSRLEWQIWLIVCGAFGLMVFEIINAFSAR